MASSVFRQRRRIRFSQCDPAGIVFYPKYFEMFNDLMEAWVDTLMPGGFSDYILQQKLGLPSVHIDVDFHAVSRMGDDVELSLEVINVGRSSMTLRLQCADLNGEKRVTVQQKVVVTSLETHRAIPVPDVFREYAAPLPSNNNQE